MIVRPEDATNVADAVVRVFIEHGDRTNRNKARLKYVLDAWGFDKFIAAVEEKLARKLDRVPAEAVPPRPAFDRTAHIGVHAQKQPGLNWIGVVLPVGRLTVAQMRGLATHRARTRRRRHPPDRVAEPADLRRAGREGEGRRSRHRGARALHQCDLDPRRPRRLHRQCRLPLCGLRYQAARRGDRPVVRGARRRRHAGQHPPHRLPPFLRPALHRRHRPHRLQGRDRRRRAIRSRAITSTSAAASAPTRRWPRDLPRRARPTRRRRRSSGC